MLLGLAGTALVATLGLLVLALVRLDERTGRDLADARAETRAVGQRLAATEQAAADLAGEVEALRRALATIDDLVAQVRDDVDLVEDTLADAPDVAAVAAAAIPSVVTVVTPDGSGSGWVVRASADTSSIITNHHVVDGAIGRGETVVVRAGEVRLEGRIVAFAAADDLALLEVDASLPVLAPADGLPAVGETVVVVGAPFGLEGTTTTGIVSALRGDRIQFSAPVGPGSSGGPLLDLDARVLGVTVAKVVGTGAEGLSFAIPVATACDRLAAC